MPASPETEPLRAPVGVSCGEPAGIGPELIEAAWGRLRGNVPLLWIGDPRHLPGTVPHRVVRNPMDALTCAAEALPVWPLDMMGPRVPGRPQPAQAAGVIEAIETGVHLTQTGDCAALCTLPIHKAALAQGAGFEHPGHTEFLAALAGVDEVVMMLASDRLRVVPVTIHIPLSQVPGVLTPALLERRLKITHDGLQRLFGLSRPRIAVAGLNPHAGEEGRMGTEDRDVIAPVLERLRTEGMDLRGPLPADTMFHERARAGYDAAVCMYHDQALIPIKTLDFDAGVNLTLGLPFVRTSPDHGTAFDIAGTGCANPSSTIAALRLAARLAARAAAPAPQQA